MPQPKPTLSQIQIEAIARTVVFERWPKRRQRPEKKLDIWMAQRFGSVEMSIPEGATVWLIYRRTGIDTHTLMRWLDTITELVEAEIRRLDTVAVVLDSKPPEESALNYKVTVYAGSDAWGVTDTTQKTVIERTG